jgi:hypothetical protein
MFQFVVPKNHVGQLVVKWVKWEFSKIGTSGSISRGDHSSLPNKFQDTSSTLFVTGVSLGYSMICFENPQLTPFITLLEGFMDL